MVEKLKAKTEPAKAAPRDYLKEEADKRAADEAVEAKRVADEKKKVNEATAKAMEKTAKANANLAKDGSATRMDAEVRDGKIRYRFGNFVPTRDLTEDELKAVDTL